MKPLPLLSFLALTLGGLLGGCATSVRPDSILVSVADLKPASATATETRVVMTLRFTSESLNAFGFSGSAHKLYLNGGYVGRAVSDQPIGLPPMSSSTHDVTLVLENAAVMKQLLALRGSSTVPYRLETTLFTKTGDDEQRIKSKFEGTIDLRALQADSR
ncbi:MAG: Water Stress and Hypersensitive response domain protein [Verrucomicrobia bacterium]|nr:Water Stress and Hypersensitive response domain protein [Verrucomicrobiota bacterium]